MEELEIKLCSFFEILNEHFSKYKIVFLSKRFLEVYQALWEEDLILELPNYSLYDEFDSYNKKVIYINDINYELPLKKRFQDKIFTFNHVLQITMQLCWNKKGNDLIPCTIEDYKKEKEFNESLKKNPKSFYFYRQMNSDDTLYFLAREIEFLEEKGRSDVLDLLPDFLKNYFWFHVENQVILDDYFRILYQKMVLNLNDEKSSVLLRKETLDEIITCYGKENIPENVRVWLEKNQNWYYQFLRISIKNEKKAIQKTIGQYKEDEKLW